MIVTVVGAGHVGLVVGACLADLGWNVRCVDKNSQMIDELHRGHLPFFEPGLQEMVDQAVQARSLSFSSNLGDSTRGSSIIFIAVGTESMTDGMISLDSVYETVAEIAEAIDQYKVIVVKSTAPVGTARALAKFIERKQPNRVPFDVVSNPEFLQQGSAIKAFLHPARIVIGTTSARALAVMSDLYRPLQTRGIPIVVTTNETAELIKFAANAFLALKISYANELAHLCEALGCEIHTVSKAIGLDPRIGSQFLQPGPGFGGSCLPKDARSLTWLSRQSGVPMNLVEMALRVNDAQPGWVVSKLQRCLGALTDQVVAVLGLSYKSNTDDVRESPALKVCDLLLQKGARLRLYDPEANENARRLLANSRVEFCTSPYEASRHSACLVVLTDWNEFRDLDLRKLKANLAGKLLFDVRNIYDPSAVVQAGLVYEGIGRPSASLGLNYSDRPAEAATSSLAREELA